MCLCEYVGEILRSNPRSTCQISVSRIITKMPTSFNRLYTCLDVSKKGLLASCKPMIGLNGCFLKWYYRGQLLCAIG